LAGRTIELIGAEVVVPRGRVRWFDPKSGEGVIARGGREYPVVAADVERGDLVPRVPVHFDVERVGGVARAIKVEVDPGTRSGRLHGRAGESTHAPDRSGGEPLRRGKPGLTRRTVGHPKLLVQEWLHVLASGDYPTATLFYAPDAELETEGRLVAGRRAIQDELRALTPGEHDRIRVRGEEGDRVVVEWASRAGRRRVTSLVRHGLIRRQSVETR
jgi:hypothetical protein